MTADKMAIDKVLLEVLNNRFTGIVEEMGYVIHRAAFTTFVKETWDFDSALVTTDGDAVETGGLVADLCAAVVEFGRHADPCIDPQGLAHLLSQECAD